MIIDYREASKARDMDERQHSIAFPFNKFNECKITCDKSTESLP